MPLPPAFPERGGQASILSPQFDVLFLQGSLPLQNLPLPAKWHVSGIWPLAALYCLVNWLGFPQ